MTKEELKKIPYIKSNKRPHMSILDRSAQFLPFAALTGHEDQIGETSRLTDSKVMLDEYEKLDLNDKLFAVLKLNHPLVTITYFIKDLNKEGGRYDYVTKQIKKYDDYNKRLIFDDSSIIDLEDIVSIDHEIFNNFL